MPKLPDLQEIKYLRQKLDISQKDLEHVLAIPQATISRIENGKGNPSYYAVKKIFDYLELKQLERKTSEKHAQNVMSKSIISITPESTIREAVNLMTENNISQLPIIEERKNLGSITAKKIQKFIIEDRHLLNAKVELIKELPFPEIEKDWNIADISGLLTRYPAILVKQKEDFIGIITDSDLLKI